jgi:hypothetical protein
VEGDTAEFFVVKVNDSMAWVGGQLVAGVSASTAELNILDGVTATTAEINRVADPTGRIVSPSAASTSLALTAALHADRIVLVPVITGAGLTITLPAATGTGDRYKIINNGVQTVALTVTALAGDIMYGKSIGWSLSAGANDLFYPTAADIKYTFNITTTGGDGGDTVDLIDIGTDAWWISVEFTGSSTLATGFA